MKKVFKVVAIYRQGAMRPTTLHLDKINISGQMQACPTGHWVLAENKKDALRIAKVHKIGNPMGTDDIKCHELCCIMDKEPPCKNGCRGFDPNRKYGGKVWEEIDGKLIGHKTPFSNS